MSKWINYIDIFKYKDNTEMNELNKKKLWSLLSTISVMLPSKERFDGNNRKSYLESSKRILFLIRDALLGTIKMYYTFYQLLQFKIDSKTK